MNKAPTAIICLSDGTGGLESDAIKYAKRLSAITHTILIVKRNTFLSSKAANDDCIKIYDISFWGSVSLSLHFSIKKIIIENNIKNIVFFGASELKTLYFTFKDLDVNFIIRHGTRKGPKNKWYHSRIYSIVDYHIGISKDLTNNIKKSVPFHKSTVIKTIYPSIVFNSKPKPRILDNQIKILNTGRIAEGKGHIDLINACKVLYEKKFNFVMNIVGDGNSSYVEKIKKHANNMAYSNKIIFHGYQSNITKHLNNNDIFLFPSHGEGLSNSFTEGLSHGLVCLSYNNTSFSEFKDLGFHTHLVDNKNQDALTKELLIIAENLNYEKIKSLNNINHALKIFSYENELRKYKQILI
jgi:glycosyltransferase involved in cell wall biosynthesis